MTEKITAIGGRTVRTRTEEYEGTVYHIHSVFCNENTLSSLLLTLMKNELSAEDNVNKNGGDYLSVPVIDFEDKK